MYTCRGVLRGCGLRAKAAVIGNAQAIFEPITTPRNFKTQQGQHSVQPGSARRLEAKHSSKSARATLVPVAQTKSSR